MNYLTNEKLVIVGAGGAIGSNMAQTALMLGLTPNICLYDIFAPGCEGVAEEMRHCGFEGANVTWTVDPKEAFTGAKYIISSGGAPRKDGMTREDLLKGNCKIAAEFGDLIKTYCPDVKHVVVIFNPADVTALTALIHSGLKPSQLTSLAALDSTRLQEAIAEVCGVPQYKVAEAHTYGGHGEAMAVFASKVTVDGKPLAEYNIPADKWEEIKHETILDKQLASLGLEFTDEMKAEISDKGLKTAGSPESPMGKIVQYALAEYTENVQDYQTANAIYQQIGQALQSAENMESQLNLWSSINLMKGNIIFQIFDYFSAIIIAIIFSV